MVSTYLHISSLQHLNNVMLWLGGISPSIHGSFRIERDEGVPGLVLGHL